MFISGKSLTEYICGKSPESLASLAISLIEKQSTKALNWN
jgi:hypothetical protein